MTRRPYFVIFATMRTGSNLLEKTLAELDDTICYGEAFNPAFIGEPRFHECLGWDRARRDADPLGFLHRLQEAAEGLIAGFRVFDGHDPTLMSYALADPECRKIVLRRDPVDSYLSLKIARETGQWLLRDSSRRIALRVTFDAEEFSSYHDRLNDHYAWIDAQLAAAEQKAMYVAYDELSDPGVLKRIAQHIGSTVDPPAYQPIARQNPQHIAHKVTNYAEMCEALGMVPEIPPEPRAIEPSDIRLAQLTPLAFASVSGPGFAAGLSLIYRFEQRFYDGPSLSYTQLLRDGRNGTFAPPSGPGLAVDGRTCFALSCHPANRMLGLMDEALFGPGWRVSAVRRAIESRIGTLPTSRAAVMDHVPTSKLSGVFEAFLDLVAEARQGTGVVELSPEWRSQAAVLETCKQTVPVDHVADVEDLNATVIWLSGQLGVPGLPASHVSDVMQRALPRHLPGTAFMTDAVLERLRTLFPQDFLQFGYENWPKSWIAADA